MATRVVRSAWETMALAVATWCVLIVFSSPAEAASTITLQQAVHFAAPDGSDIVAEAGTYQVEATESRLSLTAEGRAPLLLDAKPTTHDEKTDTPLAITVSGEDPDLLHVVLLLPKGQALDAVGSLSGTRLRGTQVVIATTAQIHASVKQAGPVIVRAPNDFDLAYRYAPIHYQDTDSTNYRADYITRFDYDGNTIAFDNWEHLTNFPLAAHAYYSVVETCTHWYIVYGVYHPRDWTDGNEQEHENDLEGFLSIVRKDGTSYGRLEGMVTVAHEDFYSFVPPGSPPRNGHESIDGTLTMQQYDGSLRPLTVQQAKGHGLKAFPFTSDFHGNPNEDGIIYFPSRTRAGVPASGNDRHVDYMLLDFLAAGGLWQRQLDEAPLARSQAQSFAKWGTFKGDEGGGCGGSYSSPFRTCASDSARTPWGWDDHDDGPIYVGEMALDPAHLTAHYFSGLGAFSTKYIRNRYASDMKARGYRHGNVPRGWSKEMKNSLGQTVVLDDRTERVNLDDLFSRLTTTCP